MKENDTDLTSIGQGHRLKPGKRITYSFAESIALGFFSCLVYILCRSQDFIVHVKSKMSM